jgi:DNA processing protein
MDEGGSTFAVLGCGIDVVYPDRHGPLFAEIAVAGGLLTEFPPGTPPKGTQFPSRNRIVAALAETVIVVEANFASGALVTARLALAMGRRLLAVPGSAGTEALLADGRAQPVAGGADLRRALAGEAPPARDVPASIAPLLAAMGGGAARPALEVAQRLGVALPAALALISEAELDGWVRRRPGGKFEVTRDS